MIRFLFSCSYATCAIPETYRAIYEPIQNEVQSPAGWDPGALNLGQAFAMRFHTPLVHGEVSRLLIDLEQEGDAAWSPRSLEIPESSRVRLADRNAGSYREILCQRIDDSIRRGGTLVHGFLRTHPGGDGTVDLETYQSSAMAEQIAERWSNRIMEGGLYARLRKRAEGTPLSRSLATKFPHSTYVQISLSMAQSFFLEGRPTKWASARKLVVEAFQAACAGIDALNDPEDFSSPPG